MARDVHRLRRRRRRRAAHDRASNPQRLDTLVGKILRIIPDPAEHVATSTLSENGRYRIPNDNPFVSKPGAKKEIWAYGLRNPHRLSWAADPSDPRRHHLIAAVVGLRTWEMVNIIRKGANYGYSQREGNQLLQPDNVIAPLPAVDKIAVQIGDEVTDEVVVPDLSCRPVRTRARPAATASAADIVYTGKALPALRGKYIFSDLSTGRVWYADWKEMLAADDGDPKTMAQMHEVKFAGRTRCTTRSRRSRRRPTRRAAARIPICPAAALCQARGVPMRASRSTPPASCSSTARPTA